MKMEFVNARRKTTYKAKKESVTVRQKQLHTKSNA